jgi:hypothetical protein
VTARQFSVIALSSRHPQHRSTEFAKTKMKILIDNYDGAGLRDCTALAAADEPPRIVRRLNRPSELQLALLAADPALVLPAAGARIVVEQSDGAQLFTGYLQATQACDYLGWGERGPAYRIVFRAISDESLLDAQSLAEALTFTAQTPAQIVGRLTAALLPVAFETTAVLASEPLAVFSAAPGKSWSSLIAEVAQLAGAAYRVSDGAVTMAPLGAQAHAFSEGDATFRPRDLKLRVDPPALNDVAVLGPTEPLNYVRDYFFNDQQLTAFPPSHIPFRQDEPVLLDEDYSAPLDFARWSVVDPGAGINVVAGLQLNVPGGSDGSTVVRFADELELSGGLVLAHGQVQFTGACDAVLGGIFSDAVVIANCIAGFRVTTPAAQPVVQPLVNGLGIGTSFTTRADRAYRLRTRLHSPEPFRLAQRYHSSTHASGSARTAGDLASTLHVVLELFEVDPAAPAAAVPQVLWEGTLDAAPAAAVYGLVSGGAIHANIVATRLWRAPDVELTITDPGQFPRDVLVGAAEDGAEATLTRSPELRFFASHVPVFQAQIVMRYRTAARAAARVVNAAAPAPRGPDSGVRAASMIVAAPLPRTSDDCAAAANALLDDGELPSMRGEYVTARPFLAADVYPGDSISFALASRDLLASGIVREVTLDLSDLAGDATDYRITFANEAAESLLAPVASGKQPSVRLRKLNYDAPLPYAASLAEAAVSSIATDIIIDAGAVPAPGGGYEVRSSDSGWSADDGVNLLGRFTTRQFTVPRFSTADDYYIRAFDAASPRNYSRCSAVLHVEYPI